MRVISKKEVLIKFYVDLIDTLRAYLKCCYLV